MRWPRIDQGHGEIAPLMKTQSRQDYSKDIITSQASQESNQDIICYSIKLISAPALLACNIHVHADDLDSIAKFMGTTDRMHNARENSSGLNDIEEHNTHPVSEFQATEIENHRTHLVQRFIINVHNDIKP